MSSLIDIVDTAEPSTPSTGRGRVYLDSADNKIKFKDDAGTVYDLTDTGPVAPVDSVNTQTGVVVLDTDDISEGTNKYTSAAEITKLSNIEALADVTDEANVTDALDGATLSAVTVAGTDKILIQDTSDTDILKTVTAQSIADLGGGGKLKNTAAVTDTGATVASASTTWVTVFSLAITPTSASSVIDISAGVKVSSTSGSTNGSLRITRNGTPVITDLDMHSIANNVQRYNLFYRDSPATTSPVTYAVQINRFSGTGSFEVLGTADNSRTMKLYEIGV